MTRPPSRNQRGLLRPGPRRRRLPLALALGASLLLAGAGRALDPHKAIGQYTLTVWRGTEGLPQDSLTAVVQDRGGALWLGTPAGLVRFDGSEFVRRPADPDETPAERYVTGILRAADGGVWIATRESLLELPAEGGLRRHGLDAGIPAGGALALAEAGEGALWLATERGVVRFANGRGELLRSPDGAPLELGAQAVARAADGGLLAGTDRGLLRIDQRGARRLGRADGLPSDLVTAVLQDRAGKIWIGTALGLVRLADDRIDQPAAARAIGPIWIRTLFEDRDGNLWVGARGGGAYRIAGERVDGLDAEIGLPNAIVRQIHEDRDGALWFATAGGLARLADGPVTTWSVGQGLAVPFVWSVDEDPAGNLWIGTSGGGVARLTGDGLRRAPFADAGLEGTEIRALLTDRLGTLWIGTGGNGLAFVRDGRVGWVAGLEGLGARWVSSLLEDRQGRLWVGTGEGLVRVESGRVRATYRRFAGGPPVAVRSLAEDREGGLWVGLASGLARFDGERLVEAPGSARLAAMRIHCILPGADGDLWLATDGGLARLANGVLERWTTREGLPIDMLYWLIEDGPGQLWISSDVGILRLPMSQIEQLGRGERERLEPLVLGREDGLRANECNSGHPAGIARRDGSFCFATTDGLACAAPGRLDALAQPPPVEIRTLSIDGAAHGGASGATPVTLTSGVRRLEIRYAATALAAAEKLTFRYRLAGFDPGWIDAGAQRVAQFTGLPPGRYRFSVEARRAGGAWSEPAASAPLVLLPAFHQTATFYALVGAAALLVGAGAYRLRTRRLRERARRLTAVVEERTRELARANAELERLSLADGLTGIANRRHFDQSLDGEWRRAARAGTPVSLLLADIDRFKAYNDTYGHLAGDECLRAVAAAVAAGVQRAEDLVARYGGEELAVLLPGSTASDAARLAERLRGAVEALDLRHEGGEGQRVTLSIGVATAAPAPEKRPEALIVAADRALYRAKAGGRNRVETGG